MRIYSNVLKLSDLNPGDPPVPVPPEGVWIELSDATNVHGPYLARLYDLDSNMRVGLWYKNRADFHAKTTGIYRRHSHV